MDRDLSQELEATAPISQSGGRGLRRKGASLEQLGPWDTPSAAFDSSCWLRTAVTR